MKTYKRKLSDFSLTPEEISVRNFLYKGYSLIDEITPDSKELRKSITPLLKTYNFKKCGNKYCPDVFLPERLFSKATSSPDGLKATCKRCDQIRNERLRIEAELPTKKVFVPSVIATEVKKPEPELPKNPTLFADFLEITPVLAELESVRNKITAIINILSNNVRS